MAMYMTDMTGTSTEESQPIFSDPAKNRYSEAMRRMTPMTSGTGELCRLGI